MSNASGGDRIVFRDRVSELQDKLKKSEEERLRLEAQFDIMMNAAREEEAARLSMLRGKYEKIVECEKRRRDRNDQILHTLDRIESRTAMIVAKSERLQLLRRHYEAYVSSIYPAWNGHAISSAYNGFTIPQIKPVPKFDHQPPRNGARSPILQKDPLLFPLNPVKGAYISPYATQKPYDQIPSSLSQIHRMPVFEQTISVNPQEIIPPSQYSQQDIPVINQPLSNTPPRVPNVLYQQESISPKQNLLYPSPAMPRTIRPHSPNHYENIDKFATNEYRRRNLFPDEPFNTLLEGAARVTENGVESYFSGLADNDVSRNETNLKLNGYMKKTADLLNYTMRDYGKEGSKAHDDEESKLANSTDFELEQNTSGDLLNISLSDDGILNQEDSASKTRDVKQEIPDIAYDTDDGFKSRKVVHFDESQDSPSKKDGITNKARESGTRANAVTAKVLRDDASQGDKTVPPSNSWEDDRRDEKSQELPIEYIPENEEVGEKSREIQGERDEEYDNNQEVHRNDEVRDRELFYEPTSQDIREVDSGIGREDFDRYKTSQQEYQDENKISELDGSQYLEAESENLNYDQEQVGAEQYEISEQPAAEDQEYEQTEYESKQIEEQGEYVETEGTGYLTESQLASDPRNAEQTYETENQGEYVLQDQSEYAQGEEGSGYVSQDQYGEQQYGDQYQGPYEAGQEDLAPQEELQYEGGEYQEQYQEQDGQYGADQNQYQTEDQGHYEVDNQGQYGVDSQGQYVGQNQYEGQHQYDEGQSQYAEGQNQYEDGQNQYAEQQGPYAEDQSQYEVQDQGLYASEDQDIIEGQDQYAAENQDHYQEGYSEEAHQEYPQQQDQEYVESNYQLENKWQGDQGGEVYFDEGKYHEPTSGYERDETGGEYLQSGAEGETANEMPGSSQEQVHYDESQEYSVQEQNENNVERSPEFVGDNIQDLNDDTTISSDIEVEQNVSGKETSQSPASKPRKSGLAMLDSDTESSMHLGNAAVSNDDSDFDFSSGK